MSDPKLSVSQEVAGIVDTGAESFSVDKLAVPKDQSESDDSAIEQGKERTPAPDENPSVEDHSEEVDASKGGEVEEKEQPQVSDPPGVEKRIGKLTKKYRDQERATAVEIQRRQAIEAEAEALRVENQKLKKLEQETTYNERPVEDDYDTEAEYLEALTDYKVNQKFVGLNERLQQELAAKENAEAQKAYVEQVERIKKSLSPGQTAYADWDDVIEGLEIPTATLPILEILDNAADVVYALGSDPAKANALSEMSPALAGAELQRISMNLKNRKTPNAPKPIKPVGTSGSSIKTLENMSNAEYRKFRDKQDKARRSG